MVRSFSTLQYIFTRVIPASTAVGQPCCTSCRSRTTYYSCSTAVRATVPNPSSCGLTECTVPMGSTKGKIIKIYILVMWIGPLAQKVYADFKNCLNKFHIISERLAF